MHHRRITSWPIKKSSPALKKESQNDKTNYRPVSILLLFSSIYEGLIYKQIKQMVQNVPLIFQCGFLKKYSTRHALIAIIKKAKKSVEYGKTFDTFLTDLSKAFDYMTHGLHTSKLLALNFDRNALNLIFDYLARRKKRV